MNAKNKNTWKTVGAFLYMSPRDEHLKWEVGVIWWSSGVYVGVVHGSSGLKCPNIKVAQLNEGSIFRSDDRPSKNLLKKFELKN